MCVYFADSAHFCPRSRTSSSSTHFRFVCTEAQLIYFTSVLELNRSRTSSPLCSQPATPATRSRTSPPLHLEQSHPQNRSSSSESVREGGNGGGAHAVEEEEELGRWRRRKEISQFLAQSFSLSPFPPHPTPHHTTPPHTTPHHHPPTSLSLSPFPPPLSHITYSLCLAPHTVAPTQHMHTCTHTHTHTHTHTQLATKLLGKLAASSPPQLVQEVRP
jgi:hypothetical protein